MIADPCTDPRATELMAIDDTALSALIGCFVDATRRASFASRGLTAAASETVWTGTAADAFKGSVGKMPRQLDQVLNSYYGVRAALETYRAEVDQLKLRWTRSMAAIDREQRPRRTTARLPPTTAYVRACTAGTGVLHDFDAARSTLCSAIDTASHHSITPGSFLGEPQATPSGGDGGVPIARDGSADGGGSTVPAAVRAKLARMDAYVKSVMGTQYLDGGGHGSFHPNGGLDRSGFVSGVLHSAGYLDAPRTASAPPGRPGVLAGHGCYVTIYDRTNCALGDQHVIIDLNGQFYEEGGISSGGAADVRRFTPTLEYLASFDQFLHPGGM